MKQQTRGSLMLLLCAMVWGAAFVAQSEGMNYVGPFTMQATRYFLSGLVLLPVIALRDKKGISVRPAGKAAKRQLLCGVICGALLCTASIIQQYGHHPHHGRKVRLHHDDVHHPRSVSGAFREAACQAHELGLRGSGAYGSLSSVRRRRGVVRGEHRRLADASVRGFLRLPHSLYRPRLP